MIADLVVCHRSAHVIPSYEKVEIAALADKQEDWTEEEIHTLYLQTGLGKSALLAMKQQYPYYEDNIEVPLSKRLQPFQDALFYEGARNHEHVAEISNRDRMTDFLAPVAPVMEAGDVFVNSSTHTLGFRNGHAALVLDTLGTVLMSLERGADSAIKIHGDRLFSEASNFILLRLKDEGKDVRTAIAKNAERDLVGIRYSLSIGLFSKKYQGVRPKSTHCSHLVWQAYKNAGYDIDYNGGPIVTPQDIARSPLFEVIQVYGFDPEKLW